MWIVSAVFSALFAGITTILAKCGVKKTDSDVATAVRTGVVLLLSWGMVFLVGSQNGLSGLSWQDWLFLLLSGVATGASWLCYFKALSLGEVSRVVAIDKTSASLTVFLAILFLGERANVGVKIVCALLIAVGALLTVDFKKLKTDGKEKGKGKWKKSYLFYAVLSALFASLSTVFAKAGMSDVESNLATAVRTGVVFLFAWGMVLGRGKGKLLGSIDQRELLFILLSGVATGVSWLCYYYAVSQGQVSVVVPIDKLSVVVAVVLSAIFFQEKPSARTVAGLLLLTSVTILMAICS